MFVILSLPRHKADSREMTMLTVPETVINEVMKDCIDTKICI